MALRLIYDLVHEVQLPDRVRLIGVRRVFEDRAAQLLYADFRTKGEDHLREFEQALSLTAGFRVTIMDVTLHDTRVRPRAPTL